MDNKPQTAADKVSAAKGSASSKKQKPEILIQSSNQSDGEDVNGAAALSQDFNSLKTGATSFKTEKFNPQKYMPPQWLNAKGHSCCESLEILIFRLIAYFPVFITFSLIIFLSSFYILCYIYPTLIGDYESTLGIPDYWANQTEKENDKYWALIVLGIFCFCAFSLILSILLTIFTDPGSLNQNQEFDLPEPVLIKNDQVKQKKDDEYMRNSISSSSTCADFRSEQFINDEIEEDQQYPVDPVHFDFGFIKSKQGPLFYDDSENQNLLKKKSKKKNQKYEIPQKQIQSVEQKKFGGARMCQRCLVFKPDRTHHCRQCNKCVLKMDHHCPWVANCIGFYNYKYFLNMLFYSSVTSLLIVVTSYEVFISVLAYEGIDIGIAYFVVTAWILALTFCFIITGFFCFHMYLVSKQYTTIEFCEKRTSNEQLQSESPYDRGCFRNFQTVLGNWFLFWFCVFGRNLQGDGLEFEVKDELKKKNEVKDNSSQASSKEKSQKSNGSQKFKQEQSDEPQMDLLLENQNEK